MAPYVAQLVPKLYRYQHDPNARVRDAMGQIWRALVDDPRAALDAHFEVCLWQHGFVGAAHYIMGCSDVLVPFLMLLMKHPPLPK